MSWWTVLAAVLLALVLVIGVAIFGNGSIDRCVRNARILPIDSKDVARADDH